MAEKPSVGASGELRPVLCAVEFDSCDEIMVNSALLDSIWARQILRYKVVFIPRGAGMTCSP